MPDYTSSTRSARELREYLRGDMRAGSSASAVPVAEFDAFLQDVAMLFRLRNAAEERFRYSPHLARSGNGALPLEWKNIGEILAGTEAPDGSLVSEIAKECLHSVEEVLGSLRVVLSRSREKVGIGKVQQIDARCMQWLVRQPGRDPIEKAGARQEIFAVVRRENFNTLENRVFKDFLVRYRPLAQQYLEKNKKFSHTGNVKRVARLEKLCVAGTRLPELEGVSALRDLPAPNYALQQHPNYSKIWTAYVSIVERSNIEERLWEKRQDVAGTLKNLREKLDLFVDPRVKFHAQIWFNRLGGRQHILCNPCWKNEILPCEPCGNAEEGTAGATCENGCEPLVVDLTGREPRRNELLYLVHENAKPCLENPQWREHPDEIKKRILRRDILREFLRDSGGDDEHLRDEHLRDYFEQLHALVGGGKWTILVPDDWDDRRQERIVRAAPAGTVLLWRSVAAIRGAEVAEQCDAKENDVVAVVDFQTTGTLISKLTLLRREGDATTLVPQRSSFARNGADGVPKRYIFFQNEARSRNDGNDVIEEIVRFLATSARAKKVVVLGYTDEVLRERLCDEFGAANVCFQGDEDDFCRKGAKVVAADIASGRVPYYDTLERLSMVVQTEAEEVVEKPLVEGTDKWPGGEEYSGQEITDLFLAAGENKLVSYFSEGVFCDDKPLKEGEFAFPNATRERVSLGVRASLVPGQGLAKVSISAKGFLASPVQFDLQKLKEVLVTKNYLEEIMKRSFPPTCPYVEASPDLWRSVREEVSDYLDCKLPANGKWFAQAENKYPNGKVPKGESPANVLKRINVFGNDPKCPFPESKKPFPFDELFKKLACDYKNAKKGEYKLQIIRLIAWTYQAQNLLFKKAREDALEHFCRFADNEKINAFPLGRCGNRRRRRFADNGKINAFPPPQEITLCANLCNTPDEWRLLMAGIVKILSKNDVLGVENTLRLFYNLLQFNEGFAKEIFEKKFDVAKTMQDLIWWYTYYALKPDYTNVGYVLRCMLFLLRIRRYDGKKFFTKEHDRENYDALSGRLKCPLPHSVKNPWRQVVVDYLNGRGTLPGVAMMMR